MNITGAELITRFLQHRSPRSAYAVAGAGLRPLQLELEAAGLVPARADEAAVLFADLREGFDTTAVVLAQAKSRRRPLLCIAVQVQRSLIGTTTCRPETTRPVLDALTRQWFHVGAAMELLELLPQSAQIAAARRGPVLLEIPEDVMAERIESAWIPHVRSAPKLSSLTLQYA